MKIIKYKDWNKEKLIKRIYELEELVNLFYQERELEEKLNFPWAGHLGHWYWNYQTNTVNFNPLKIISLGFSKNEIPENINYDFFTEKLHSEDYERVMDNMKKHLQGKSPVYEVEYRIKTKQGDWKWFWDIGKVTKRDSEGIPILVAGIVFDITKRKEIEEELKEKNIQLAEMVKIDGLTKILNRRVIIEKLEEMIKQAKRTGQKFSILMLDIDYFKKVNDNYGHLFGDQVLTRVAEIIKSSIRDDIDQVGRYGGEEFLVLLINSNQEEGVIISERIRESIEKLSFSNGAKITISGGLKEFEHETVIKLIEEADKKLYTAKNNGRNRIEY